MKNGKLRRESCSSQQRGRNRAFCRQGLSNTPHFLLTFLEGLLTDFLCPAPGKAAEEPPTGMPEDPHLEDPSPGEVRKSPPSGPSKTSECLIGREVLGMAGSHCDAAGNSTCMSLHGGRHSQTLDLACGLRFGALCFRQIT